ncbi:hypothetical protein L7F22_066150 [Adiantum nelumboides]|nr:hypothetical protein [Adiantum nelumboides]
MGEPSTSWQNFNFRDDDGSAQGMQALRLLLAKLQEAQANPRLKPSVNNLSMTEDLMLTSTQRLPSSVAPMHLEGGEGVPVMHGPMQANVVPHPLQGPLQTDGAKKKQYHGQERHVGKIREEGDFHDDDDEPPSRSRHKKRTNERRTKRSRRNSSGGSSSSSQSGRSSHGRFPKKGVEPCYLHIREVGTNKVVSSTFLKGTELNNRRSFLILSLFLIRLEDIEDLDNLRREDYEKVRAYVENTAPSDDEQSANEVVDGEFAIETAKSSRAACKSCSEKIEKGQVRVSTMVTSFRGKVPAWRHAKCFFELNWWKKPLEELPGWEELIIKDQKTAQELVNPGPNHAVSLKETPKQKGPKRKVKEQDEQSAPGGQTKRGRRKEVKPEPENVKLATIK